MKYMRSSRQIIESLESDNDPMNGLVNLFDTAVVFIAVLLLALISVFDAKDMFEKDSELTILKKSASGKMTLIRKKGRKLKAVKMTREEAAGKGIRLGTAYRLEDGSMIYVPEE